MHVTLPDFPVGPHGSFREVSAFADTIVQTLRITRALLLSGRMVSLEGLEGQIAQLCARCLGMAQQEATLRVHLLAIRAELDATALLLDDWLAGTSCHSTTS